jgi:hypothetical protein
MALQIVLDLTDEEEKAFNLIVPDAETWIMDAYQNKLIQCGRRCMDLLMQYPNALTPAQINQLKTALEGAGVPFWTKPRDWPLIIIRQVVAAMDVPTRAERDAAEQGA